MVSGVNDRPTGQKGPGLHSRWIRPTRSVSGSLPAESLVSKPLTRAIYLSTASSEPEFSPAPQRQCINHNGPDPLSSPGMKAAAAGGFIVNRYSQGRASRYHCVVFLERCTPLPGEPVLYPRARYGALQLLWDVTWFKTSGDTNYRGL